MEDPREEPGLSSQEVKDIYLSYATMGLPNDLKNQLDDVKKEIMQAAPVEAANGEVANEADDERAAYEASLEGTANASETPSSTHADESFSVLQRLDGQMVDA